MPSETRQKVGEERLPLEHGAPGLASAYSLRLFSLTRHSAAPLLLSQPLQFSCAPSCPRTLAQAIPQTGKISPPSPRHPWRDWLLPECSMKLPCAKRSFLSLNPTYTFSFLILVTFYFSVYTAWITNYGINRYILLFFCLPPPQERKPHEGRACWSFFLQALFAFRRCSLNTW